MYKFLNFLTNYVDLDEKDVDFLINTLNIRSFQKSEYLLKEGDVSTKFFFIEKGLVRLFYNHDGEEKTAYFYNKDYFVSAYASFIKKEACQFNLQALEGTTCVEISLEASIALLQYHHKFEFLARVAMEEELMKHQEIIASLLMLKPEERYNELLHKTPDLFQRVPQHMIASHLGVKPESLSRIKKRQMAS